MSTDKNYSVLYTFTIVNILHMHISVIAIMCHQFDASRGSRYWSRIWTTQGACASNGEISSAEIPPSVKAGSSTAWGFRHRP